VVDAAWLIAGVRDPAAAIAARRVGFGPNLAAHLTDTIGAIDTDRAARGVTRPPVIWSTYAGQVEAHYGVLHPHTDYIIHAIGPAGRDEYLAAFRRTGPDYVVTFRRDTFAYEEWLENATWAFFQEVLLNYEPLAAGSVAVVWRRTDHPWRIPTTEGRVSRDPEAPDRFTVPVPPGLPPDAALVVEVEYEVRNPLRQIPVVGGLPRYLLGPSGCLNETPVSLPPYRRSWSFPVFPVAGQTPTFFAGTFSLVGGRVTVTKVHVRPLRADGRERALLDPDSLGAR